MDIQLSPEVEAMVNEKVADGDFDSPSAVVEQALRMTLHQADTESWELVDLRHEIQRGKDDLENGRISTISADDIKARIRQFAADRSTDRAA